MTIATFAFREANNSPGGVQWVASVACSPVRHSAAHSLLCDDDARLGTDLLSRNYKYNNVFN